jgi:hypothetical protein
VGFHSGIVPGPILNTTTVSDKSFEGWSFLLRSRRKAEG